MSSSLSEEQLFKLGLSFIGFDESRQGTKKDNRRYRAHYGISPAAMKALIADLETKGKRVTPKSLFMAICWLKLYDIEETMAGRWGHDEKTCRNIVFEYTRRIQKLKRIKISMDTLHKDCKFLGVDTIHVRSQEFRCDPSSKWWSHKFNGPGVSFEVVTDPVDGKIRWINGPQPASVHDLTFLRGGQAGKMNTWDRDSLYFNVPDGVKLVGDSAYAGQLDKVTTTQDAHKASTKKLFGRIKSLNEKANGRFKNFRAVRDSFRHGKNENDKLKKIKMAFEATAVLVQYDIESGHDLYEV